MNDTTILGMSPLVAVLVFLVLILALLWVLLDLKKRTKALACPCGCCGEEGAVKTVIGIEGMSCSHCTSRVEAAFADLGMSATADLETKTVTVLSDAPLNEAEIRSMIENLGFTPGNFETLLA